MTSTIDLAPIMCLSVPERIGIIQSILDSIAVEAEKPELSDSIKSELERRLADSRANPDADIPWEQVKADILDSIANDAAKPELSEEMKAELTQRIAEYRANPELAIPWELAKARLLSACVS